MPHEQRPDEERETETEVIPPVTSGDGIAHTRELPVVQDEPTVVTPPPQPALPTPTAAAPPAVAAPPAAAAPPGGRRRPVLAVVVLVAVLAVVAGVVALAGRGGDGAAESSRSGRLPSTITSFDPSGGSGFRQDGAAWRTQSYASPSFGNLKEGVGLLLDLGASRVVGSVTFEVAGGPIAVELRAADSASGSASEYRRIAADPSASGSTTLTVKDGAEHRYWLIWVTKLGAADGGYRAVIRAPTALGPRS
jgi:hypothetical protein